jgi:exodeoxyribonuclease VII small subunit
VSGDEQSTSLPAADVPATDVPPADMPSADVPSADMPAADVPSADVPRVGDTPASYAAACDELDEILADLEQGRADVDALTEQVARARYLLAFCSDRLTGARLQVSDVLDELDGRTAAQ